jgi:hypothetical protein
MTKPDATWREPLRARAPFVVSKTSYTNNIRTCCPAWHTFHETRAQRRAVDWLVDNALIDDNAATRFINDHPDPDVP